MAIGGIGSSGLSSYFNYYSAMSQVRLQQALSKNPSYQKAVGAVGGIKNVSKGFQSESTEFLKSYQSTMTEVMKSANNLRTVNSNGVMNDFEAVSSDTDVASVSEHYRLRSANSLELSVEQLAQAQSNVSAKSGSTAEASESMDFTIQSNAGRFSDINVKVDAQKQDGSMKTNREMLKEAAAQINGSKAGLTASVVEKDGQVSLSVKAGQTGTSHGFQISGTLGAAGGLDTAAVEAQNAKYSVKDGNTELSYASESNDVRLNLGRIDATLKSTGTTTIRSQVSDKSIVSAVEDLVDSYNDALTFLDANADRGSGVMNQIGNFVRDLTSEQSLKQMGITTQKDGTLKLDKETLSKSIKEDPGFVKDLISGQGGLAQTVFNRALSAKSANSMSLVDYELEDAMNLSTNNPINFLSQYTRNSSSNLSNYYAVGLMMNYLV